MGAYLSTPKKEKSTEVFENEYYRVASSGMQGWRTGMEDADCVHLEGKFACLGVFDGHGGKEVALYVGRYIVKELKKNASFLRSDYMASLKELFLGMDTLMLTEPAKRELHRLQADGEPAPGEVYSSFAGCTAVFAMIHDNVLYVANAGDSRAVLGRAGTAVDMTYDHKPDNPEEFARITKAGGTVEDGRIMGNLNLSRSLGDYEYKQNASLPAEEQMVTANPELKQIQLTPQDEFIILACDGVWDVLTNQEAVDFVRQRIPTQPIQSIVEEIFDRCLATDVASSGGIGCDNMTCIILSFK